MRFWTPRIWCYIWSHFINTHWSTDKTISSTWNYLIIDLRCDMCKQPAIGLIHGLIVRPQVTQQIPNYEMLFWCWANISCMLGTSSWSEFYHTILSKRLIKLILKPNLAGRTTWTRWTCIMQGYLEDLRFIYCDPLHLKCQIKAHNWSSWHQGIFVHTKDCQGM